MASQKNAKFVRNVNISAEMLLKVNGKYVSISYQLRKTYRICYKNTFVPEYLSTVTA